MTVMLCEECQVRVLGEMEESGEVLTIHLRVPPAIGRCTGCENVGTVLPTELPDQANGDESKGGTQP